MEITVSTFYLFVGDWAMHYLGVGKRHSVLVVDDFPTSRAGIRHTLESDGRFRVVGEAGDGREGLRLLEELSPRAVVLDLGLPQVPGIEVAEAARQARPRIAIVVQTMFADEETAVRAFQAGADAYVLKQDPPQALLSALESALRRKRWLSSGLSREALHNAENLLAAPDPMSTLTDREFQVLRLIAQGLTSREAGSHMGISHRTVETYRARLMTKLGLNGHRELVRYAYRRGVVR
jgi:DNA-binding NarL/FixJ family response regulator